jgi:putative membrane protein
MYFSNWSYYVTQPWMWVKLASVLGLAVWHGMAASYRKQLLEGRCTKTHTYFRVMNEIPTIFMVVVVIMVIVRPWSH